MVPILYGLHFPWIREALPILEYVRHVFDSASEEMTFLRFHCQFGSFQSLEKLPDFIKMFLKIFSRVPGLSLSATVCAPSILSLPEEANISSIYGLAAGHRRVTC